ncbi:MAG: hypothetical protein AAF709_25690 [Pseudomonadota bacterium]
MTGPADNNTLQLTLDSAAALAVAKTSSASSAAELGRYVAWVTGRVNLGLLFVCLTGCGSSSITRSGVPDVYDPIPHFPDSFSVLWDKAYFGDHLQELNEPILLAIKGDVLRLTSVPHDEPPLAIRIHRSGQTKYRFVGTFYDGYGGWGSDAIPKSKRAYPQFTAEFDLDSEQWEELVELAEKATEQPDRVPKGRWRDPETGYQVEEVCVSVHGTLVAVETKLDDFYEYKFFHGCDLPNESTAFDLLCKKLVELMPVLPNVGAVYCRDAS